MLSRFGRWIRLRYRRWKLRKSAAPFIPGNRVLIGGETYLVVDAAPGKITVATPSGDTDIYITE